MSQAERNERRVLSGQRAIRDRVRHYAGIPDRTQIEGKFIRVKKGFEPNLANGLIVIDIFDGNYPLATSITNPTAAHSGVREYFFLYAADQHTNTDTVLCLKDQANGISTVTISEGLLDLKNFPFFSTLTQLELNDQQRRRIKQLFNIEI